MQSCRDKREDMPTGFQVRAFMRTQRKRRSSAGVPPVEDLTVGEVHQILTPYRMPTTKEGIEVLNEIEPMLVWIEYSPKYGLVVVFMTNTMGDHVLLEWRSHGSRSDPFTVKGDCTWGDEMDGYGLILLGSDTVVDPLTWTDYHNKHQRPKHSFREFALASCKTESGFAYMACLKGIKRYAHVRFGIDLRISCGGGDSMRALTMAIRYVCVAHSLVVQLLVPLFQHSCRQAVLSRHHGLAILWLLTLFHMHFSSTHSMHEVEVFFLRSAENASCPVPATKPVDRAGTTAVSLEPVAAQVLRCTFIPPCTLRCVRTAMRVDSFCPLPKRVTHTPPCKCFVLPFVGFDPVHSSVCTGIPRDYLCLPRTLHRTRALRAPLLDNPVGEQSGQ
jgi:hypothetical protein